MQSRGMIIGLIVILLVGGFLFWSNRMASQFNQQATSQATPTEEVSNGEVSDDEFVKEENIMEEQEEGTEAVVVEVRGFEFGFSPEEIKVKKGDKVRVVFKNTGKMTHNFVVDEFGVSTQIIAGGAQDTVEFVADTAGTFEFYCSVGNHRALGMVGKLIVE